MKIRTDFVTNSSSSSFTTVQVQNRVLCELLKNHRRQLGLGSVSTDLIELVPYNDEAGRGSYACYPDDYDSAVSEIWKILNSISRNSPELKASLTDSKSDIDACFEKILFSDGYNEWGGDGDLRYDWSFPKGTSAEAIDNGAAEENVYYYSADLKNGTATEKTGIRHYTISGSFRSSITSFFWAEMDSDENLQKSSFSCETVNVEEIANRYKKSTITIYKGTNTAISGKTFAVTGDVHVFKSRNALKAYIEDNGGKLSGSVTGKTDYLISNDAASASSKSMAARANNVPVITEDEFVSGFNINCGSDGVASGGSGKPKKITIPVGETSVIVPEDVVHITIPYSVTSITFPESVTGFDKDAFSDGCGTMIINAPNVSPAPFSSDVKCALARGFAIAVAQGRTVSDERREEYLKCIRGQRKKMCSYAVTDPELMRLMLDEKMIQKGELQDMLNMVDSTAHPEISAMLRDRMNAVFKPGELEKAEKKKNEEASTGVLSVANAKKEWKYEKKEDGTIRILGYKGTNTDVTVPSVIGKAVVSEIGRSAFSGCSSLTGITIPEGVTEIGAHAFDGCRGLADKEGLVIIRNAVHSYHGEGGDIVIPAGVTSIELEAFANCSSLASITIPEGVTEIGVSTFKGCSSLTSITIPKSVTRIGDSTFKGCSSLRSITIPESVTWIGSGAFNGCRKLTVHAPAGSYAEKYAMDLGIPFEAE